MIASLFKRFPIESVLFSNKVLRLFCLIARFLESLDIAIGLMIFPRSYILLLTGFNILVFGKKSSPSNLFLILLPISIIDKLGFFYASKYGISEFPLFISWIVLRDYPPVLPVSSIGHCLPVNVCFYILISKLGCSIFCFIFLKF